MKRTKRWPIRGQSRKQIMQSLNRALGENIDYKDKEDLVIGFPGTTPAPIGVEAFQMFLPRHPNNIGTHTSGEGEKGFPGTQRLEREAIFMMADLLGANSVDGYITPGGNESNIMGLLLAREHLKHLVERAPSDERYKEYITLTSIFSHYSIRKAAWAVGIGRDKWGYCPECSTKFAKFEKEIRHLYEGKGVDLLGADEAGRLLVDQLEERIIYHYKEGVRRFIVVANEGNIITGGVDNTTRIGEVIANMRLRVPDAGFFLHVDACFGGFVIPFLDGFDHSFSFHVPEVDSVAIDPHKMGEMPYPAGMFIYRRSDEDKDDDNDDDNDYEFRNLLGVQMGYVPGDKDGTLCGSRPGASAAACYAVIQERGRRGYKRVVDRCMERTAYLAEKLSAIPDIEVLPHDLNIVAFRLRGPASRELSKTFTDDVKLVHHRFPEDFSDPNGHVRKVYKATVMSHVTKEKIDQFVRLLKKELTVTK